jgi:ABC-type nitrate/sulfonate/bicarbonate transport system permease component
MTGIERQTLSERITTRLGMGPLIGILVLFIWEMVTRTLQVAPSTLPSPTRLVLEIWREAPQLARNAWVTGLTAMEGMAFALLASLLGAGLSFWAPGARRLTAPLLSFLQKTPLFALVPLLVVWFGYGRPPAVVFSFLISFLALAPHLQSGFFSLPAEVFEMLRAIRATPLQVLWKVQLPACLPYMTRSLKLTLPLALAGAAVAELVGADSGLGFQMLHASSRADSVQIFAALSVLSLMALCGCFVIFLIEQIWLSWPATEIDRPKRDRFENPYRRTI